MTVIAWDGRFVAADRMAVVSGNTMVRIRKLRRFDDTVIGGSGSTSNIGEVFEWFSAGADPEKYPAVQRTADWAPVMAFRVGDPQYFVRYEQSPYPTRFDGPPFFATGSGCEFAFGALACGKNAIEAVRITNSLTNLCGMGVQWVDLLTGEEGFED